MLTCALNGFLMRKRCQYTVDTWMDNIRAMVFGFFSLRHQSDDGSLLTGQEPYTCSPRVTLEQSVFTWQ